MDRRQAVTGALLLFAVVAMAAMPAANAGVYLKFEGVDGESMDKDHEGWIVVDSLSTTMNVLPAGVTQGGGQARRRSDVILGDLTVTKYTDKSSPKISEAICNGKTFPKVEIHVTASAATPYYRYELTNARVTSYSVTAGGSAGERPMETITLSFGKIKVDYDQMGTSDKAKGNVETQYKVERGEK